MRHARAGQAGLVSRRLTGTHDPLALHAALVAKGRRPFLFRRTGQRALIVADFALRLEATGPDARICAVSEGGALLLEAVTERLAAHVTDRSDSDLSLHFPRCDDPDEEARAAAPTALDALRAMIAAAAPTDGDEPFATLAAGIIGFDHVDMVEDLPPRPTGDFPDLVFLLAETAIVVEASGAARVLAMAVGSDDEKTAHRQHHLAADRLANLSAICEHARAPAPVPAEPVSAAPDLDDAAFEATVVRLKEHITAGDIFQAVPSRVFRARCDAPDVAFRRLVAADPSAYHY